MCWTTNPNLGSEICSAFFETTVSRHPTIQLQYLYSCPSLEFCAPDLVLNLYSLISMGRDNKNEHLEELLIQKDQEVRIQIHTYLPCESIFLFVR